MITKKSPGSRRRDIPLAAASSILPRTAWAQADAPLAESLIREVGFEPVVVGGLDMDKYVTVGTPLASEHTPAEITQTAADLH